jgi:hypothetical protein
MGTREEEERDGEENGHDSSEENDMWVREKMKR